MPDLASSRASSLAVLILIFRDNGNCARTLQGMARVRSGQAPAWPLVLTGVLAVVPRVKRDFAGCTLTGAFPPVLIALRAQSCLGLEGRARTLSGPSPDPRLAPAARFPGPRSPGYSVLLMLGAAWGSFSAGDPGRFPCTCALLA